MSDIETSDWSEIAANNIQPAPAGWPANSSPMIVYSNGREDMGAIKRDWNRRNPTVTSGGAANVQTLTYSQGPVAYVMGQTFTFIVGFLNSGATTLNVNGLGAKNVFLGGVACTGGELVVGAVVQVVYDGTQFQIIGASAGKASAAGYLPLTGGTLTGTLTIAPASPNTLFLRGSTSTFAYLDRASGNAASLNGQTSGLNRWALQLGDVSPESTGNAGSDFGINRYNDAGTFIDKPLSINRASGQTTLTVTPVAPTYAINNTAGSNRQVVGYTSLSGRWALKLGNNTAEGGANAGSDFSLDRFNDAGTLIDSPLGIIRSTGIVNITTQLNIGAIPGGGSIGVNMSSTVAANGRVLAGYTSGVLRWQLALGNNVAEGGSNAGSDTLFNAYNDAGTYLFSPISIKRSTGVTTFSIAIVNGPSDRSLKENIAPLDGALDKVQQLKGVSFNFIKDADKRRQIGLIAQDVAPIVPEVMQDFVQPDEEPKLAIDYTRLVPLLVEAIKELTAKVARLEAGLATASQA